MLGSGWLRPVSSPPFPLLPLLLWLAAGTGACSCFFDDSTMLPHPPPSRRFFSPNRLAVVRFSFFSLVPALLARRDTEQVNRAHHTLHVSVFVMCSVLFSANKMAIVLLLCGTSLHLAQIASDLVGSF